MLLWAFRGVTLSYIKIDGKVRTRRCAFYADSRSCQRP
jgi:hypothetical protein